MIMISKITTKPLNYNLPQNISSNLIRRKMQLLVVYFAHLYTIVFGKLHCLRKQKGNTVTPLRRSEAKGETSTLQGYHISPFSCEFWLYACSTLLIQNLERTGKRFRLQGELFSIRFQSHRWSNNFLYYRLKSLWIFKHRGRRSGYSSKLSIPTKNEAIPAICSRPCKKDRCAS